MDEFLKETQSKLKELQKKVTSNPNDFQQDPERTLIWSKDEIDALDLVVEAIADCLPQAQAE